MTAVGGTGWHRVTVWRLESLPGSETFIRNQVDAMTRWQPTLLGSVRVASAVARVTDPVVFDRSLRDRIALLMAAVTGRARRVRAAVAATDPDLVHAHFAKDAGMIRRAARRLRVPVVVTVHGYDVTALVAARGLRGTWARHRIRAVLRDADRVIAVSEFIRDRAIALGAPPGRVVVAPIGVPTRDATASTPRTVDVVFLGRLVPKKGVVDALRAVAAVPGGQSLRCEVIGDGPLRAAAEREAARLGLDVRFRGMLPPSAVADALGRARVLLAPSQRAADGDAAGFGMVFLEAALAGVPAVAYRHGGVPEAVVDTVTGLLAPEADVTALADALHRVLSDEQFRARLGAAARHRVITEFDIGIRTRALERIYDDVLAARGP
ncbi:glycosyltransferase [Microbacterium sp.]|uniref:glycosyltransferase n=1 Tax=Microbacterium sp. TaxID=51671 RepID=UPI003A840808